MTTLRREFLDPLAESSAREDLKNYVEIYPIPLSLALLALVAQVIVGSRRHRIPRLPSPIRRRVAP